MSNQSFETLPGFPQTEETVLPFGGQEHYSEGFLVRFRKEDGASWIGNFKRGYTELSGVFSLPATSELVVFAGGCAYIVNREVMTVGREFGNGYCQNLVQSKEGAIIISDLTSVIIVERDGEVWISERISWDGIKDLKLDGDVVTGLSFDPMSDEKWIGFSVNVKTRVVTGGGYRRYDI